MKLLPILFFTFLFNFSYSQGIDFKTEKEIIKQTLSQYLDTNSVSADLQSVPATARHSTNNLKPIFVGTDCKSALSEFLV